MNSDIWTPQELHKALLAHTPLRLIDVREPEEYAICHLPQAELIPLSQLPQQAAEIAATKHPVLLYCHHGVRSEMALRFLQQSGAKNISHLQGGIDAWAEQIDPAMPRY